MAEVQPIRCFLFYCIFYNEKGNKLRSLNNQYIEYLLCLIRCLNEYHASIEVNASL